MINKSDILLVIVNYNQQKEIANFLLSLKPHWDVHQSIIVDDGSEDGSKELALASGFTCVAHARNQGIGAAIRTGIQYAKSKNYKAVLIMSSNGKMIPSEIPRLVEPVISGAADYTTGSRFLNGGAFPGLSLFRRISIPIFSLISTILIGRSFSDITCGFRCYKIDFLFGEHCNIDQAWLSRYELEYYIHYWACVLNLKIQEVPVTIKYSHLERKRTSKIRPLVDWWSMMRPLLWLRLGIKK